jgi:hypothetical protein
VTARSLALLDDLAALDVHLRAENGQLRYDAPAGVLTPALRTRVTKLRAELLDSLEVARILGPWTEGPRLQPLQSPAIPQAVPVAVAVAPLLPLDDFRGPLGHHPEYRAAVAAMDPREIARNPPGVTYPRAPWEVSRG